MNGKYRGLLCLLAAVMFISLFAGSVLAAVEKNPLKALADGLGKLNLGDTYNYAPYFFDGIILAIIFITLSFIVLKKRFEGRAGNVLAITVGVAMAVGFEAWNYSVKGGGYTLISLGPYFALVLMLFFGTMFYYFLTHFVNIGNVNSALISVVLVWYSFKSMVPNFFESISEQVGILAAALSLVEVIMILAVFILIVNAFKALFGGWGGAAKSVGDKLIEAGGVTGGAEKLKDYAKNLWGREKEAEKGVEDAQTQAEKGDQEAARNELNEVIAELTKELEQLKQTRDGASQQAGAFKKIATSDEMKAEISVLQKNIAELSQKMTALSGVIDKIGVVVGSSRPVTPEVLKKVKGEIEAVSPTGVAEKTIKSAEDIEKAIKKFYVKLIQEQNKVERWLMLEVAWLTRITKAKSVESVKGTIRKAERRERRQYGAAKQLTGLLKQANPAKAEELSSLEGQLVKLIARGGEFDKDINEENITKVKKTASDAIKIADGILALLKQK